MSDPTWLPDVLRAAGLKVLEYPGWRDRGHGDFGDIWGIVDHHTGSFGETPRGIAEHPELGLASQLYLSRDGVYTICGVGVAWHAGNGSWAGIERNNANQVTIGIEAANDGGGSPGKPHRTGWSDAQYSAYVTGNAAILNKLGQPASHSIGHKEWAGAAQGKWDPGAIDMNIFRADIAREQTRLHNGGGAPTIPGGGTVATLDEKLKNWNNQEVDVRTLLRYDDQYIGLLLDQLLGPGSRAQDGSPTRWEILGNRTVVEALGALLVALEVPPVPKK